MNQSFGVVPVARVVVTLPVKLAVGSGLTVRLVANVVDGVRKSTAAFCR
ncbi:MAG: hypothetical protein ACK533_08735 [Planctomycetota bacterium]